MKSGEAYIDRLERMNFKAVNQRLVEVAQKQLEDDRLNGKISRDQWKVLMDRVWALHERLIEDDRWEVREESLKIDSRVYDGSPNSRS